MQFIPLATTKVWPKSALKPEGILTLNFASTVCIYSPISTFVHSFRSNFKSGLGFLFIINGILIHFDTLQPTLCTFYYNPEFYASTFFQYFPRFYKLHNKIVICWKLKTEYLKKIGIYSVPYQYNTQYKPLRPITKKQEFS